MHIIDICQYSYSLIRHTNFKLHSSYIIPIDVCSKLNLDLPCSKHKANALLRKEYSKSLKEEFPITYSTTRDISEFKYTHRQSLLEQDNRKYRECFSPTYNLQGGFKMKLNLAYGSQINQF